MVGRLLVTTALTETLGVSEPILFLGEWCLQYDRRELLKARDYQIVSYHWDDREKLKNDYVMLTNTYEALLKKSSSKLNKVHGVNRSVRYWRIVIGPWLAYFIHIVFDRYECLNRALSQYDVSHTVLIQRPNKLVLSDMSQLSNLYLGDDWNHQIIGRMLEMLKPSLCVTQQAPPLDLHPRSPSFTIKSRLRKYVSKIAKSFVSNKDGYMVSTYLPQLDELMLQLKLGQFPQFRFQQEIECYSPEAQCRDWSLQEGVQTEFEEILCKLIPEQMPTAYLESYATIVNSLDKSGLPAHPSFIWTSNSHFTDDLFKIWSADKIEKGCPLAIGQHGGAYGMCAFSFLEDHENSICDAYFSWGWNDAERTDILPLGQLKRKKPLGVDHTSKESALLITGVLPRYTHWLHSVSIGRQWLDYFEDQCAFITALPVEVRHAFTVRLYPIDYGWSQEQRWMDRFPAQSIDRGKGPIDKQLQASRLVVSTYNATSYLETIAMGVPTVMFWNESHWELRASAETYFEKLKEVGIFHNSPESAADHVAMIWDNVDAWWGSDSVQEVLEEFRSEFCADSNLNKIHEALVTLSR